MDPWILPPGLCTSIDVGSYRVECFVPNETASGADTTNSAPASETLTDGDAQNFGKDTVVSLSTGLLVLFGAVLAISLRIYYRRSQMTFPLIRAMLRRFQVAVAFLESGEVDLKPGMVRVRYTRVCTIIMPQIQPDTDYDSDMRSWIIR